MHEPRKKTLFPDADCVGYAHANQGLLAAGSSGEELNPHNSSYRMGGSSGVVVVRRMLLQPCAAVACKRLSHAQWEDSLAVARTVATATFRVPTPESRQYWQHPSLGLRACRRAYPSSCPPSPSPPPPPPLCQLRSLVPAPPTCAQSCSCAPKLPSCPLQLASCAPNACPLCTQPYPFWNLVISRVHCLDSPRTLDFGDWGSLRCVGFEFGLSDRVRGSGRRIMRA